MLFLVGWLLAHELYASGKLEDCLMSGRTNCAPIEAKAPAGHPLNPSRNAPRHSPMAPRA